MELKAEKISRRFFRRTGNANYFYAVKPLDLTISSGELIVLTGRSGSGKTTLLSMLSGLLTPTEGDVFLDETRLYGLPDKELSRLRNEKTGVVLQGRSAIDTLTILENILLPAKLYGRPLPYTEARRWAELLGIGNLLEVRPPSLSGGELRRMAIVRALAADPEFLFADEPTADLDDENTRLVLEVFRTYAHERNKAVFLVTHEGSALQYADRIYRMDAGTLKETGDGSLSPADRGDGSPVSQSDRRDGSPVFQSDRRRDSGDGSPVTADRRAVLLSSNQHARDNRTVPTVKHARDNRTVPTVSTDRRTVPTVTPTVTINTQYD